jgi:zinc protease
MGRVWTAVCALAIGLIATTAASGALAAPAKAPPASATTPKPKRKSLPAGGDILARPDPSVLRGQLPNGLRYAVMHNATPAKSLSIRFYVQTGSLDESDSERGMAHFLEHMAFEGGKRFATGEILTTSFLEAGVSLGRDQNAFTDALGTDYVLDLQNISDAKLDMVFGWLRDVADGLRLDQGALDTERGVVLSEYNVRRDGATAVGEMVQSFLTPGLLGPKRNPGGVPETVGKINAAAMQAFYHKWYRPDRTFIIVVGDAPVEQLKARIEATFGSWSADAPPPVEPDRGRLDSRRSEGVFEINAPNFARGDLEICRVRPVDSAESPSLKAWKRFAADAVWGSALNERFAHIARRADAPFFDAQVSRREPYESAALVCLVATPKPNRWQDALETLSDEMRRLEAHGVTETERKRELKSLEAVMEAAAAGAGTRTTPQLAQSLLSPMRHGLTVAAPASLRQLFLAAEPSITKEAVSSQIKARWSDAGAPLLVMVSNTPSTPEILRRAWAAVKAKPTPAAPIETPEAAWAYANFGAPGEVTVRQEMQEPDFVRLGFANGVHVNFKRLTFVKDRIDIRIRFGGGQSEFNADDQLTASLGAAMLLDGGLGQHDAEALSHLLEGHIWSARLSLDRDHFALSGSTRPRDLDFELELLTALLVDPGFRPEIDLRVPSEVKALYKGYRIEPLTAAQQALNDILLRPHVFDLPPETQAVGLKASDFQRLLKPALTTSPLEITIVGDIDEATAAKAVARTLGALPPRGDTSRTPADAAHGRFPAPAPSALKTSHIGLPEKAAVYAVWPLFVWQPDRQREVRALTLLREVFNERLRETVREKLGQSYTPSVGLLEDRGGDQGYMAASVETSPAATAAVAGEITRIAAGLATGDVSAKELEQVRKPLLDDTAHRKETNGWWLNTLDGSWGEPYKLAQARTWQADYSHIPVEEVRAAAKRWLAQAPIIITALPEQAQFANGAKPVGDVRPTSANGGTAQIAK